MRSMQWQLGILGTVSALAYRHRGGTRVDVAGRRTFLILTSSQQSGIPLTKTTMFLAVGLGWEGGEGREVN